jgi:hypothetical protein
MHAWKLLARESGGPVSGLDLIALRSALKILREQSSDERVQGV